MTPQGDAPIVVLASRSYPNHLPNPIFVLYSNGRVIFGDPRTPAYRTCLLPADQVSDLYSRLSPKVLAAWDNEVFTPGGSSAPTYYLFVRRDDGSFVSMASYNLSPGSGPVVWPEATQPPSAVMQALEFLAEYDCEAASPWTPAEIEVAFELQASGPLPEQKAWWPKTWPQPKLNQRQIPTIRLDSSHAEELNEHLRRDGIVRIGSQAFDVDPRYPFPYEESVVAPMNALARKGGVFP